MTDIAALAPELVAQIILYLGSLYFFLAGRDTIRVGILSLCLSRRLRLRTAHIFRDAEWFVSRYLLSINLGLGLATAAAMAALGVPQPILWGMLAFGLNYLIYIGPAVMAVILFGAGSAFMTVLRPSSIRHLPIFASTSSRRSSSRRR